MLARIRALLRRRELDRCHTSPPNDRIEVGDPSTGSGQAIVLDRAAHQVWRAGRLIDMPPREYDVLCVLMENAGQAVSHHELLDRVWGDNWFGYPRTLSVHIYRLRQKLEDDPSMPRFIQTVHGYGYRFAAPALRQAQDTVASPAGGVPPQAGTNARAG